MPAFFLLIGRIYSKKKKKNDVSNRKARRGRGAQEHKRREKEIGELTAGSLFINISFKVALMSCSFLSNKTSTSSPSNSEELKPSNFSACSFVPVTPLCTSNHLNPHSCRISLLSYTFYSSHIKIRKLELIKRYGRRSDCAEWLSGTDPGFTSLDQKFNIFLRVKFVVKRLIITN